MINPKCFVNFNSTLSLTSKKDLLKELVTELFTSNFWEGELELKAFKRNPHKDKRGFKLVFTLMVEVPVLEADQLEKDEATFEVVVELREVNL